jgi:protein-S-isoprenylcysteine O-methyltransferase Ste14
MRALADRRLPEPYRGWIDRATALPPDVVMVPRTIDVGHDALLLAGLTLPLGVVGAFLLMMTSKIDPATDGWAQLLIVGLIGVALWITPVLLLRRLILTVGASADRKRGALRQGIFIGAEGALVRMEPNRCHPIPAERFVSAKVIGPPSLTKGSRAPMVVVETLDGTITLFANRLDGHPGRIGEAARALWPEELRPKAGRSKRKVRVDHARTAGVQRATTVFGGSILAFFGALVVLKTAGASWSNPAVKAIVVGLLLLVAGSAAYILFEFVRMRAFYRCPQCRTRAARVLEAQPKVRYFCAACKVEWETGLEESDHD